MGEADGIDIDPAKVDKTGDDSPAGSLYGYVWRLSGRHQLYIALVACGVALLGMVPLELQRRIINGALAQSDMALLFTLGGIYLGVILLQGGLKFGMRLYQGWLSESAIRYTRMHLLGLAEKKAADQGDEGGNGRAVSIIGAEVEKLGGFVGEAVSTPVVNAGMLMSIFGYMVVVEPIIAFGSLAFFVPQIIAMPLIQRVINRLTDRRIGMLRDLSDGIAENGHGDRDQKTDRHETTISTIHAIFGNRMHILFWKFLGKAVINLLNAAGPLSVLAIGGYLVIHDETTIGVLVAFTSGFDRMADPLRDLFSFYRLTAQTRVQHDSIAKWM